MADEGLLQDGVLQASSHEARGAADSSASDMPEAIVCSIYQHRDFHSLCSHLLLQLRYAQHPPLTKG